MEGLGLRVPVPGGVCPQVYGKSSSESNQCTTLEEAWKEQGSAFTWRSVKFREVGGVLQWQTSPVQFSCALLVQTGFPFGLEQDSRVFGDYRFVHKPG